LHCELKSSPLPNYFHVEMAAWVCKIATCWKACLLSKFAHAIFLIFIHDESLFSPLAILEYIFVPILSTWVVVGAMSLFFFFFFCDNSWFRMRHFDEFVSHMCSIHCY
jgi:hypothetical protein